MKGDGRGWPQESLGLHEKIWIMFSRTKCQLTCMNIYTSTWGDTDALLKTAVPNEPRLLKMPCVPVSQTEIEFWAANCRWRGALLEMVNEKNVSGISYISPAFQLVRQAELHLFSNPGSFLPLFQDDYFSPFFGTRSLCTSFPLKSWDALIELFPITP